MITSSPNFGLRTLEHYHRAMDAAAGEHRPADPNEVGMRGTHSID